MRGTLSGACRQSGDSLALACAELMDHSHGHGHGHEHDEHDTSSIGKVTAYIDKTA